MNNEGVQEFIVDQGLYYPAASNYYGYYCTGFESPRELDDHNTFFGVDGSDLHYAGLQVESSPYVYYTPSYECTQSPYNPYNPYIPGAIIGADGQFVGAQQYYTGPTYEYPSSSPTYFPFLIQSGTDSILNSSLEPHLINTGAPPAYIPDGSGLKRNRPSVAGRLSKAPPRPFSGDVSSEPATSAPNQTYSSTKISNQPKANAGLSKYPTVHTSITSASVSHSASSKFTQGRSASGSVQAAEQFLLGRDSTLNNPLKVTSPVSNDLSEFGASTRGWATMDKPMPRMQYDGILSNGDRGLDLLGTQNRGPRTNRSKGQWTSPASAKAYGTDSGASTTQGHTNIYSKEYNQEDFLVNYTDAKFFVIKSYSEDDVHKSIKYNVWSSTPNGNKRLDCAYEDAQRIAAGKPRGCPIFLFFSVNASGQFCGVAEMSGPVDFHKDMYFWQQDKWSGSFPVKWHIIKDVPNGNFRHIILENNEYKPVTNSRDTQEIRCKQGIEMLNVFKNYTSKTSIFDDFMYYEHRQKIMQEEKSRLLRKSYNSLSFIPANVPSDKINGSFNQPPSAEDEKPISQVGQNNSEKTVASTNKQVLTEPDASSSSSSTNGDYKHNVVVDVGDETLVSKMDSLDIDAKKHEIEPSSSSSAITKLDTEAVDVVRVGSIPVKVNGFTRASSGTLTVGTIEIYPEAFTTNHT